MNSETKFIEGRSQKGKEKKKTCPRKDELVGAL